VLASSIRSKIVLPYLILTLIVAIVGTYVVTSLVAGSLDERLTNHLLESGRVVSDGMVRQEVRHLEAARIVAFTQGLAEALQAGDRAGVVSLAQPIAVGLDVEMLSLAGPEGQTVLHVLKQDDGTMQVSGESFDMASLAMVRTILATGDVHALPQRGVGRHPLSERYYYITALPVSLEGQVVGVVLVGTSLDALAPYFKSTSLAEVTFHVGQGSAVVTTFTFLDPENRAFLLDELSISPALYDEVIQSEKMTVGQNVRIRGRWYRLAQGPLSVGDDRFAVFTVGLPAQFIIQAGAASRNTYALLFSGATACVIIVGYVISRRITEPLLKLVSTSQAVAEGDLEQRTGIRGVDEVGRLATTFDEMTIRLAERTYALERLLKAQKEATGRMRAILASIGDGVLLEDLNGTFVPLNAAAEMMLEDLAANFNLGPLRELPASDYEFGSQIQPNPWLLEQRRFWVGKKVISAHSAAVRTDDDELLGTVIVLRDITAEVETDQLKDAFLAHVSHELRTPLAAIKGYGELLLSGESLTEEQRDFIERMSGHTDNLIAMINQLLDFSQMEAGGQLLLRPAPVQIDQWVEDIAEDWREPMANKELEFEVQVTPSLPMMDVDAERLGWAVVNLLRNAWQYTPAGGRVTLKLYSHADYVILDVIDTGNGIPPNIQEHLFTRFYRVVHRQDYAVRGLGLGLYVSKAIVEAHEGEITFVSAEGEGSTFSIILPVEQNQSHVDG
jgi:signal transduction histidine kinase/HAMP domain-containing protein